MSPLQTSPLFISTQQETEEEVVWGENSLYTTRVIMGCEHRALMGAGGRVPAAQVFSSGYKLLRTDRKLYSPA